MRKIFKGFDYTLIITPIVLAAFGIVMIYSASMVQAVAEGLPSTYYLSRQLSWFVISLIAFIVFCFTPYKILMRFSKLIYTLCLVLLLAVLFSGEEAYNAVRSIRMFGFNIQPSEFVKLGVIIFLAKAFSEGRLYKTKFAESVLLPIGLVIVLIGLIVVQPDLGTTMIVIAISFSIIISAGLKWRHLFLIGTVFTGLIAILMPFLITDRRIARFTGAYQPFLDPEDTGQHLINSYIAIGGGGLSGEGIGQSVQKLGFLWGAHNDFIMAVIAEELGIIGVIIVVGLLATIVLRGLYISMKSTDSFGALVAIGISSMIGFQAFVNLGAISGVLPITGITLPFISYGGSSLLVLMISMGILNNIARSVNLEVEKPRLKETVPATEYKYRSGNTWSN